MKLETLFLLCIAVFMFSFTVWSDNLSVELVGREASSVVHDVYAIGNYAYVCNGGNLDIVDISDPTEPVRINRLRTTDFAMDIHVAGNYAYISGRTSGLRIIDISDAANANEVGFYKIPGNAVNSYIVDDYAYVIGHTTGLRIIDLSDPHYPHEVGYYYPPAYARDVYVIGDYAYIADAELGLRIVDVSDPANPHEVGFHYASHFSWEVHVVGNCAYLADGSAGLRVFDVSDPTNPLEIGFYDTPGDATGVHVVDNFAYVADSASGLRVIDISNPSKPNEIGFCDTPGTAERVHVFNGYAYLAERWGGLRIIDITNPVDPVVVGLYDTPGGSTGIDVLGNYAYMAAEEGLLVIDISDPHNPNEAKFYNTTQSARSPRTLEVSIIEPYAYLADYTNGLRVIDISDPLNPHEVGHCNTSVARGIYALDHYAYIADGPAGLRIIDISNPFSPKAVGHCDTPDYSWGVHVVDGYAYVADGSSGLRVIDVSDPKNPEEVASHDSRGYSWEVYVKDEYAYLADDNAGLRILDVSDPENLQEVGYHTTLGKALGVRVDESYAYVTYSVEGVYVIDVSDPSRPHEVGFYRTSHEAIGIYKGADYIYVADKDGGLSILEYTGEGNIPPAAIKDLSATPATMSAEINLTWTAPGADGDTGMASSYTVRYNTVPITKLNWDESIDVDNEPVPSPAGTLEQMKISMPYESVMYYFAVKSQDEVPNISAISNSPGTRAPIQLHKGWNIIAFMPNEPITLEEAISSFNGKCTSIWAYNAAENRWLRYIVDIPEFLNDLEYLIPGWGYWILLIDTIVWNYGANVNTSPNLLSIGKPPFLIYGEVDRNYTIEQSKSGHLITISVNVENENVDSYILGTNPRYGEYYVIEIPVDDSFNEGDLAQLYLDGIDTGGSLIRLGEMGTAKRRDIIHLTMPKITELFQNYPNPFNPETWIPYQLKENSEVAIQIHNIKGELVRELKLGYKLAGFYTSKDRAAYWDGKNETGELVANGLYFCSIRAGDFTAVRKLTISR